MASMKWSSSFAVVMLLLIVAHVTKTVAQNTCASSLGNFNVCAPYVVPGLSPNPSPPSPACCGALREVDHDCICNTLRIAARIPALCNLPPLTCANLQTGTVHP
ncbi:Bifunctional inhibitor/lipid-transfer protein/seed storage 2S albumin superfamily protein [Striga hermonthica]|uniref:Bifunctional inhibitor/lipid-transfer protein/seed storage 2S albumin superfamily protein n=1 Tax=Striga hermonthica TaxID=68872 RepID=A0A9N7MNA0_STRHE|nr:Bifunctional inhibitor/lipid-transfer protein/seed storage 2S albumin superfamily protein [Striga hermonthica]